MDKPLMIPGTSNGRFYQFPNGDYVPSVTTVTSGGSPMSPWLLKYLIKEADGDYARFRQQSNEASRIGTYVHELIESGLRGNPIALETPKVEVQRALISFSEWWNASDYKVVELEKFLWSDIMEGKSLRYKFCGTADAILRDSDGKLVLADWKTSKAIDNSMALQLSAYKILWDATHDEKIDRLLIVHCKKDFTKALPGKTFKAEHWMEYDPESLYYCHKMFTQANANRFGKFEPSVKHIYPTEFKLEVRNA